MNRRSFLATVVANIVAAPCMQAAVAPPRGLSAAQAAFLRSSFYQQVLQRGNDAIALDYVIPYRVIYRPEIARLHRAG